MLKIPSLLYATMWLVTLSTSTLAQETTPQRFHYQKPLMGTKFQIILYGTDGKKAQQAAEEAFQIAQQIENACSDYSPSSGLSILMRPPATQEISPLLAQVLKQALHIAQQTKGSYDPTLGGHSINWRRAKTRNTLPSAEAIAHAQKTSGWKNLTLTSTATTHTITKKFPTMQLDLGGIAKGYAADQMLAVLKKHGLPIATIAAGGDVCLGDPPPGKKGWNVGLKTLATDTRQRVTVSNCAVSTSGDIHQFIESEGTRYSHIVDPSTGLGLTRRTSATIIAPTATRADALATAGCVNPTIHTYIQQQRATHSFVITISPKGTTTQIISSHFPKIKHILN